jgi:curved DNA-binding protein CbpA
MHEDPFVDYYEVLQVSPNADADTIERVFRYLAKRFHPDNPHSGNTDRFELLVKAYQALSDAELRAAFDVRYQRHRSAQTALIAEGADVDDLELDRQLREQLLHLLYVKRRRDLTNPGIGAVEVERLLGRPREHLEFHFWFLREKGWIERTDNGQFAITADGVDRVEVSLRPQKPRRLEDRRQGVPRWRREAGVS